MWRSTRSLMIENLPHHTQQQQLAITLISQPTPSPPSYLVHRLGPQAIIITLFSSLLLLVLLLVVVPAMTTTSSPSTTSSCSSSSDAAVIRQLLLDEANYDVDVDATTTKRSQYLSWDDFFMSVASLSAHRSKDPRNPKGACIVDADHRVIGIGYNGFPRNCSDDLLPWLSNDDDDDDDSKEYLHTPRPYECHAEVNAILNKCSADVAGASLYVKQYPCNECAKMIAQSRIRQVVYMTDDHHDDDVYRASRIILQLSGVQVRRYTPSVKRVELDLVVTDTSDRSSSCKHHHHHHESCQQEEHDDAAPHDDEIKATDTEETTSTQEEDSDSDNNKNHQDDDDDDALHHRAILRKEANWTAPAVSSKRTDYLSWDDYFMSMAFLTAQRSKDPNTQVGACIVSPDQRILALGYNGFPNGCSDTMLPWARQSGSTMLHTKYPYVCHAEVNCILNKCSSDVKGATLYVALFPCNECAKMIIQAGIVEVVYLKDSYHDTDACRASRILFGMAGVKLRRHVPAVESITLEL